MNRIIKLGGILMLALVSCAKPVPAPLQSSTDEPRTEILQALIASSTVTKVGVDGITGVFSWQAGDTVAVYVGTAAGGSTTYAFAKAAVTDTDTGVPNFRTISVSLSASKTRTGYAVSPAVLHGAPGSTPHNYYDDAAGGVNNGLLTISLPGTYSYESFSRWGGVGSDHAAVIGSPVPMIALNNPAQDGLPEAKKARLDFYHVAALLRLTLRNIPAGTRTVSVSLGSGGSYKELWGSFPVQNLSSMTQFPTNINLYNPQPAIRLLSSSTETSPLTFVVSDAASGLTEDTTLILNVPVPVPDGFDFDALKVEARDAGGNSLVLAEFDAIRLNFYRTRGKKVDIKLSAGSVSTIQIQDLEMSQVNVNQDYLRDWD